MAIAFVLNTRRASPACEETLKRRFAESDVSLQWTRFAGHATELARAAARAGAETVVAVGGDGTVGEVVSGIADTSAALGVIPMGTANDFAAALGLPHRIEAACDVIEKGRSVRVDLLSANGRYFVSAGGLGLVCRALALSGGPGSHILLRRYLGSTIYLAGLIRALAAQGTRTEHICIQADGRRLERDVSMLMMCNQPRLGRHFTVAPDACLASGLIHLCWFEAVRSVHHLGVSMWKARHGAHRECSHVVEWTAAQVVIEREWSLPFFVDGELQPACRTIRICIHPGALRAVAPPAARVVIPGTPARRGPAESRQTPEFALRVPPESDVSRV